MYLAFYTLITALVVTTAMSTDFNCTLCPGNTAPTNGEYVLGEDDELGIITCNKAAELALTLNITECADLQLSGYVRPCSCPGEEEVTGLITYTTGCSGICPNGQPPLHHNTIVFDDVSCGQYDNYVYQNVDNETQCAEIQMQFATFCGCDGDSAPKFTCSGICTNGLPPQHADAVMFDNITCEQYDSYLYQHCLNSTQCNDIQEQFGSYCGCTNSTPMCAGICTDGQLPLNANTAFYSNSSCEQWDDYLKFLAFDDDLCTELQQEIGSNCGCVDSNPICPGVCSNGQLPPNASTTFYYNTSCEEWDNYLHGVLDNKQCNYLQQEIGSYCGCLDSAPICSGICPNGQHLHNSSTLIHDGFSCESYDAFVTQNIFNETQCTEIQWQFGSYCGCAETLTCSGLCSDGQLPPYSYTKWFNETSCAQWDEYLKLVSDTMQCTDLQQQIGVHCGCSDFAPTCSGLCTNGQPPPDPNATLFSGMSCGEYDEYLRFVSDKVECTEVQQVVGSLCGCTDSIPTCPGICPDGQPPLNANATYFDGYSCLDLDTDVHFLNETECQAIQQTFGAYCGCAGSVSTCPGVCSNGQDPPNTDAIIFNGISCGQYDASLQFINDEAQCLDIQHQIGAFCGCEQPEEICTVCYAGGVVPFEFLDVGITLSNGTEMTCGEFESSIIDLDSTQCTFDQAAIADKCGCPPHNCTLCPGGEDPLGFGFDDFETYLTCALYSAVAVSGSQPECMDFTETGLPYFCRCPNAGLPSTASGCTLCIDGIVENPNLKIPGGGTCGRLSFQLALLNETVCDDIHHSAEAWYCGCAGIEPPENLEEFLNRTSSVQIPLLFGGNDDGSVPIRNSPVLSVAPVHNVSHAPTTTTPAPTTNVKNIPVAQVTPGPVIVVTHSPTKRETTAPPTTATPTKQVTPTPTLGNAIPPKEKTSAPTMSPTRSPTASATLRPVSNAPGISSEDTPLHSPLTRIESSFTPAVTTLPTILHVPPAYNGTMSPIAKSTPMTKVTSVPTVSVTTNAPLVSPSTMTESPSQEPTHVSTIRSTDSEKLVVNSGVFGCNSLWLGSVIVAMIIIFLL